MAITKEEQRMMDAREEIFKRISTQVGYTELVDNIALWATALGVEENDPQVSEALFFYSSLLTFCLPLSVLTRGSKTVSHEVYSPTENTSTARLAAEIVLFHGVNALRTFLTAQMKSFEDLNVSGHKRTVSELAQMLGSQPTRE